MLVKLFSSVINMAPPIVPRMLPRPPLKEVPPTTTAATEVSESVSDLDKLLARIDTHTTRAA